MLSYKRTSGPKLARSQRESYSPANLRPTVYIYIYVGETQNNPMRQTKVKGLKLSLNMHLERRFPELYIDTHTTNYITCDYEIKHPLHIITRLNSVMKVAVPTASAMPSASMYSGCMTFTRRRTRKILYISISSTGLTNHRSGTEEGGKSFGIPRQNTIDAFLDIHTWKLYILEPTNHYETHLGFHSSGTIVDRQQLPGREPINRVGI